MALLSLVHTYPPTGFPSRPWHSGDDGNPTEVALDVAARSARCVADLYSQAMAGLGIEHRTSELRLFITSYPDLVGEVLALHDVDPNSEGFEFAHIAVPPSFSSVPARIRAEVLLEAIHGIVLGQAHTRGWVGDFESCRQYVIDHDFTLTYTSPWKSAPGRRHQARVRCWMTPDMAGYGKAVLEVANADGKIVAQTDEATAFSTIEGFRRSAKSLKWSNKDSVSAIPFGGWGDPARLGLASLDYREGRWQPSLVDPHEVLDLSRPDSAAPRPVVSVRPSGRHADNDERTVSIGGGGSMSNNAIWAFDARADELLAPLHSAAGREWWAASPIKHVTGFFCYQASKTHVQARLHGPELRLRIHVADADLAQHGPEAWAEVVVPMIVEKVRQRAGLGPHPGYPA